MKKHKKSDEDSALESKWLVSCSGSCLKAFYLTEIFFLMCEHEAGFSRNTRHLQLECDMLITEARTEKMALEKSRCKEGFDLVTKPLYSLLYLECGVCLI